MLCYTLNISTLISVSRGYSALQLKMFLMKKNGIFFKKAFFSIATQTLETVYVPGHTT